MNARTRSLLIAVVLLLLAPASALAEICYSVSGLPGPATFDFVLLAGSGAGPISVAGEARGVCGPGTPPAAIEGAVVGEAGTDARLALRFLAGTPGCGDGAAQIVLFPPYEWGAGQVHLAAGSVANVVLTHDPTGIACTELLETEPPTTPSGCVPGPTTLCLRGNRFRVEATSFATRPQAAHVLESSTEDGVFSFSGSTEADLSVKVVNGCSINNRYWVFASALSDVRYTLTVTDTAERQVRTYSNPLRKPTAPIQDTNAFATCP